MKKVIIIVIAVAAGFLSGTAQYNISSQIYSDFENPKFPALKNVKSGQDWWEPDTVYFFNSDFETRDFIERERHIQTYNTQGLLVEKIVQYLRNNLFVNSTLYTYSYDLNNNLLIEIYHIWVNDAWRNDTQNIWTYDSNNNYLTEIKKRWINDSWEVLSSYTYTNTYDSNNILLTSLSQKWEENTLTNNYLTTYTYDSNNNLLTKMRQNWRNYTWLNFQLELYTYDLENNILTYLYQIWNPDKDLWENVAARTYIYDFYDMTTTALYQFWGYYSLMESLVIYKYDSNDILQTSKSHRKVDNSWVIYSQNTYSYDLNNNLLTELQQNLENDSWVNSAINLRTYDENGNGISAESLQWKNEDWHPTSNYMFGFPTLWLYYNNMQSEIVGWSIDKMTASYKKVRGADTGIKEVKTESSIQIHSSGKTIHINNENGRNAIVSVYGITGIKVAEKIMSDKTTTIEMPVNGFYLVSVKADNEKPITTKVVIR